MKLIIEVTETIYELCKDWKENNVSTWSEDIIANGTPYKKGKWIDGIQGYYCSVCEEIDPSYYDHNFCPNCGSRMER